MVKESAHLRHLLLAGLLVGFPGLGLVPAGLSVPTKIVTWKDCLRQSTDWYTGPEGFRIGENVLLYQRNSGGWPKNIDMAAPLGEREKTKLEEQKRDTDSTIDNDATFTQMAYLARLFAASADPRFKDAFIKGLDYLLRAQYANGGWPQYYPRLTGYYTHITFNDDAMIGVMSLLREISRKSPEYTFIDAARQGRAGEAVEKGIQCILKCQVRIEGKRTAWCAQHDENTLAPAPARAYEKISISGGESVGIVRFLMGIDHPSTSIIDAVESAVAWFEQVKLAGIRLVEKPDSSLPRGYDRVVVPDPNAGPLWARFYEIGTNRPIFCGRDGIVKYSLAEIEYERRAGYRWYLDSAAKLLATDYPAWRKKLAR